ncbi:MAG: cytochrome c [Hyphomicrobiales bacterium]
MKSVTKMMMAGAFGLALWSGAAWAGAADDAIKARQGCMKAHGALMKAAMPIMKGEAKFDAAALKTIYDAEDAACADWAKWWGPDTQKGETVESKAKPEVWSDAAGFEAAGKAWYDAAQKLRAATDEASFKAALPGVGAGCKGCHEKYRAAEN